MKKQLKSAICLALTLFSISSTTSTVFAATRKEESLNNNTIPKTCSVQPNEIKIQTPENLSESMKITDSSSYEKILELKLPARDNTVKATKNHGIITYDTTENVNFSIETKNNGFKTLINIENSNAPKEYEFELNLPSGSKLISAEEYLGKDADTKEVFVVNSDNEITSIFSPAWAKDAKGKSIPSYYKTDGNKLIQVVEFNEKSAFPVVADPDWWKVTKCAGAIAVALGSVALPALKIGKIKKYIKALGGVKEAAMLLIGATSAAEKGTAVVTALAGLGAEITGIAGIQDNCFN